MNMVSVVVPTFNEKDNVELLFSKIDETFGRIPFEVIFVDDSTDETPDVLAAMAERDSRVRYEHRVDEKGLATAVIRGFELANGSYIAVMDADMQHPPEILRYMYAAMESGTDMCIPSRFIPGGGDGGLNIFRKFVSATARYLGKLMLSSIRKISDPTSGLFMFRREIIDKADLRPIGWKIMVEVIAMSQFSTVVEIPYVFHERTAGESKLSGKVTREYLKQLFMLRKRAVKKNVTVTKWSSDKCEKACRELVNERIS